MNPFVWQAPTKYVFGEGAASCVGAELAAAGWGRAMIVYGQGSAVRSGLLGQVEESLAEAGIAFVECGGVRPNPEVSFVRAGIAQAREQQVDVVLAIGGGSAIDAAKAIGFGTLHDGDVWDFFSGKAKVERCLPICAVLTIPAAGSEGSSSCVISNDELGTKKGTNGEAFRPRIAFMDPRVTCSLPAYQTASGISDMIAHICERSFSGVGDVPVTDGIAYSLIRSLMELAQRVLDNPDDIDARANIMWAGTLAHNGLAGVGRTLTPTARAGGWESHALEHALSAIDPRITHGAGLAVILPAWMRYVWPADPERFLLFAREVFGIEPVRPGDEGYEDEETAVRWAVEAAIDELAAFFVLIGMPSTLGEFELTPDDVNRLADEVIAVKGEPFGAFRRLTRADVVAIYQSAF